MARPKKLDERVQIHPSIDKALFKRVESMLYSELEGRIPYGAISSFLEEAIREWFKGVDNTVRSFELNENERESNNGTN